MALASVLPVWKLKIRLRFWSKWGVGSRRILFYMPDPGGCCFGGRIREGIVLGVGSGRVLFWGSDPGGYCFGGRIRESIVLGVGSRRVLFPGSDPGEYILDPGEIFYPHFCPLGGRSLS